MTVVYGRIIEFISISLVQKIFNIQQEDPIVLKTDSITQQINYILSACQRMRLSIA